jgi:hypothetical protein
MNQIRNFEEFLLEYKSLPIVSGDPEEDGPDYYFDPSDKNKDFVASLFISCLLDSEEDGEILKGKRANLTNISVSKKGDMLVYSCYFWTEDENLKSKIEAEGGDAEGREWIMRCTFPAVILQKLREGEITEQEAEEEVKKVSKWSLRDGADPSILSPKATQSPNVGGWQLAYLLDLKGRNEWLKAEKEKDDADPQWLRSIRDWITTHFG